MNLGDKILKYRKKIGLSQEELGFKLGVTRQSVSLWENNLSQPTLENLTSLAKIFNITIDQLCETEIENIEKNDNGAFLKASMQYNEKIYKKTYFIFQKNNLLIIIISLVASLLLLINSILTNEYIALYASIFFFILFIVCLIKYLLFIKNSVKNALENHPGLSCEYYFFDDYIEIISTSLKTKSEAIKKYVEIKKISHDENYTYLFFNDSFIVFNKSNLNNPKLFSLLSGSKNKNNHNGKMKHVLLSLFILSIVSLFLSLIIIAILVANSPLPDFPLSMSEYMWIFYLFLPISIISIILGIIYLKKGYRCKKNIIGGIIITLLLSIYGSFYFVFGAKISHDYNYLKDLEILTNIDFPDKGYISIEYYDQGIYDSFAMVKVYQDEKIKFEESIKDNDNWKTNTSFIPSNVIDIYTLTLTKNYDYFIVYNIDNKNYNTFDGKFIYIAYDIDTSIININYYK